MITKLLKLHVVDVFLLEYHLLEGMYFIEVRVIQGVKR